MNENGKHPIRKIRERYNLTQAEMGILIGQSGNRIAQIEHGHARLSERSLFAVTSEFKIGLNEFIQALKKYDQSSKDSIREKIKAH